MRELTKAMISFSWVMPLYGLQQMANLVRPEEWTRPGRATDALDTVSTAAREQLGGALKQAFDAGDRLSKGTVDLLFSGFNTHRGTGSGDS